jgi:hypothetical protein
MKDKDQILLENIYELIYEEKAIMANSHELIGEKVEVHPAIQGTPEKQPLYMAWSIKLNKIVVHNTKTLLLKNCTSTIKHDKINAVQLNPKLGQKTPNILVTGTIVDLDFGFDKIPNIISSGDWKSVTYNPHKHSEYIYKDKLPEWWNSDERFPHDNRRIPDMLINRIKAREERGRENFEYNEVSKKISPNLSSFNCDEILLKQYMNRGEDYMWVKGVK